MNRRLVQRRSSGSLWTAAGFLTILLTGTISWSQVRAAPIVPRDNRVWALANQYRSDQLKLLQQVVNIDSGTGDVEGGRKVGEILTQELRSFGAQVISVPAEAPNLAPNLVATFSGSGKGRLLLIGHLDTVFEPGTAAKRPFRMDEQRAYGPGVSDEKGGVVQAIFALKILHDLGFKDFRTITLLVESSEERGSPGTRQRIGKLVADADVELNLEPGDPADKITVWRKGSTTFHIDVTGRAAHAGVAPELGRNAALELIHQIEASHWPTTGSGLTSNLTVMSAGTRNNIIPEHASGQFNVRYRDKADLARVEEDFRKNALSRVIPDTQVAISSDPAFPPLSETPAVDALARRADRIYAGLGLALEHGGNGGASESALAQDGGIAALDGLGPVGGGFHSADEFLELKTLTPRLYLLTKLMMDLGRDPPGGAPGTHKP
ncbi:MAG TPA: glutamate carboxypeptidase [Sphingomicrobium sp.]|nr:glutamate carboxypeptidase [Sphingomicrobium sp.]